MFLSGAPIVLGLRLIRYYVMRHVRFLLAVPIFLKGQLEAIYLMPWNKRFGAEAVENLSNTVPEPHRDKRQERGIHPPP